jgi:hypothetical protein
MLLTFIDHKDTENTHLKSPADSLRALRVFAVKHQFGILR